MMHRLCSHVTFNRGEQGFTANAAGTGCAAVIVGLRATGGT
jgi:hypothetical protein